MHSKNSKSKTQNPNAKHETRNAKRETRNTKRETLKASNFPISFISKLHLLQL